MNTWLTELDVGSGGVCVPLGGDLARLRAHGDDEQFSRHVWLVRRPTLQRSGRPREPPRFSHVQVPHHLLKNQRVREQ